jgi:hypothetical protein
MTIQVTPGPPIFTPGSDFIRVDRGITWGIKCRDIGGPQVVFVCVKSDAGAWDIDQTMLAQLETGIDVMPQEANMNAWFTGKLLPKLNAWLAYKFPASDEPQKPATPLERADALISSRLVISANADGTLTASAR